MVLSNTVFIFKSQNKILTIFSISHLREKNIYILEEKVRDISVKIVSQNSIKYSDLREKKKENLSLLFFFSSSFGFVSWHCKNVDPIPLILKTKKLLV